MLSFHIQFCLLFVLSVLVPAQSGVEGPFWVRVVLRILQKRMLSQLVGLFSSVLGRNWVVRWQFMPCILYFKQTSLMPHSRLAPWIQKLGTTLLSPAEKKSNWQKEQLNRIRRAWGFMPYMFSLSSASGIMHKVMLVCRWLKGRRLDRRNQEMVGYS